MSNLDGVINKTKDLMNIATQKTGHIFSISKLKINKLNKEAELQKKYELLGKIFYAEYTSKTNQSINIKEVIDNIKKLETEIDDINKNILIMKNNKLCKYCGNKNNKQSLYCNTCGSPLYPINNDQSDIKVDYNVDTTSTNNNINI